MWVGIGLIVLLCFVFAFVAVRKNRFTPRAAAPFVAATLAPATQSLPATPLPSLGTLPPPTIQVSSLQITAAMDTVAKNPNDPDAHLGLSIALMDAKQIRPAMDELTQAAKLAGPNNEEFFLKAADKFSARGNWVAATSMYLHLLPMYQNKSMSKELENNYHEAVYKSAEHKDLPFFVPFERIDKANLSLGYIARGRYALYNGSLEDAKTQLAKAQKENANTYEASLLKAEIEMKSGNQAEANNILLSLPPDPRTPEWIRLMAENYLKTIK